MSNDMLAPLVYVRRRWLVQAEDEQADLMQNMLRKVSAAVVAGVLLGVPATGAHALIDDATATALAGNLDALSSGQNVPLAADTVQMLLNDPATDADWVTFFTTFFQNHLFTQPLSEFFSFAIQAPGAAPRAALVGATAAAAGAAPMLAGIGTTGRPADFGSLLYSLNTLQLMLPMLAVDSRGPIFALMTRELQGKTLDLTTVLAPGPGGSAPTAMLAMQICMTLEAYAGPGSQEASVGTYLRMPERMRTFWQNTGVFLFDNGALSDAQAASLDSLMRSFPSNLHEIVAFVAGEAYGLDPGLPGLVVSGQIIPIPAIGMDVETGPDEFIIRGLSPIAPDFTATAATNVFRAVQAVQFARRPYLALRRDAILDRSGARDVTYLRRGVAPEVFLVNPSEFLPMTAYLWLINSEAAFRMAMDFFQLSQPAPMESLLLIADILSNGTDGTLTFTISPGGIVSSAPTQIGRVETADTTEGVAVLPYPLANSIRMLDRLWQFTLGPTGKLTSLFQQSGSPPL
ncbi:MAG: hypothetical protein NTZ09_08135 [Candidatus Hydrogenedentes bacterium]|nr:hypothetical protein [Candidatus Hydrogenedentota bacterium]